MTDWDTSFEANPADTENISQGAERIRIFKEVARETIAIDHYLVPAGTMADNGKHNKATLIKQDPAPSSAADQGVLFSAAGAGTSSDTTELFYIDSAGRSRQLTWEGSAPFPVDTKMYFYQNAAPAGWEFVPGFGDRALIGAAAEAAGGVGRGAAGAPGDGGLLHGDRVHVGGAGIHSVPVMHFIHLQASCQRSSE